MSYAKLLYQCDCTTNTQIRCIHKYSENDMWKTIGGICVIVGCWVGDVGELVFILVLFTSCQQFGGYVKVVGCLWAL